MDFASITDNNTTYPKTFFEGQEDQSYGFVNPYLVLSGTNRGQQAVGNQNVKVDAAGSRFFVRNDDTNQEAVLGKIPDTDGTIALIITKNARIDDVVS